MSKCWKRCLRQGPDGARHKGRNGPKTAPWDNWSVKGFPLRSGGNVKFELKSTRFEVSPRERHTIFMPSPRYGVRMPGPSWTETSWDTDRALTSAHASAGANYFLPCGSLRSRAVQAKCSQEGYIASARTARNSVFLAGVHIRNGKNTRAPPALRGTLDTPIAQSPTMDFSTLDPCLLNQVQMPRYPCCISLCRDP